MKKLIIALLVLLSITDCAAHRINRQGEEKYLKNLDTIVLQHAGISTLVFNSDTIFIKMLQPSAVYNASSEQKWLERHPVIFTFIIALFTVLIEVELLKIALKK